MELTKEEAAKIYRALLNADGMAEALGTLGGADLLPGLPRVNESRRQAKDILEAKVESPAMTTDDVLRKVEEVQATTHDPEHAHTVEDRLFLEVLQTIAEGDYGHATELAKAAVLTAEIDFPRWSA